jgi:3-oxoadipate enol-lactonase
VTSGFLAIDGARIYHEIEGGGPPVVLVHGALLDTRMWDPQVPALADRFTVVRFDLRGFGRSTLPPTPYRCHEDIRRIVDALELDRPHLVGLSMGARFAIDYAIAYPDALRSLTVVAGGLSGDETEDSDFMARFTVVMAAAERGDLDEARRLALDFPTMAPAMAIPAVRARLEEIVSDYSWQSFREPDPWQDAERPAVDHLGEIAAPTLILIGDLDAPDNHRQARLLANGIPDARLVEIPGAGHMLSMEKPAEFNRALLDFLLSR